jgi:L-lactate dehydrogenase complex protein LldG
MRDQSAAKAAILARIPAPAGEHDALRRAEWAEIHREFRCKSAMTQEQRVALFEERVRDYGAGVYHTKQTELRETIANVLAKRGKRKIVVPPR